MIGISTTTTTSDLLTQMAAHAAGEGILIVQIHELPRFMEVQSQFDVFLYQIKNYPRIIQWESDNSQVIAHVFPFLPDIQALSRTATPIQKEKEITQTQKETYTPPDEETIFLASSFDRQLPQQNKDEIAIIPPVKVKLSSAHSSAYDISTDELEELAPQLEEQEQKQDLNRWVDKIIATKTALDELRDVPGSRLRIAGEKANVFKKWLQIATAGAIISLFLFAIFAFPTEAYTLEVQNNNIEEAGEIRVPVAEFSKKNVVLSAQAQTQASGQNEIQTSRATGQVTLINEGSRDVELSNGRFRLLTNGNRYVHVRNSTLPETIVIPAKNNRNGPTIEITIQAESTGESYNLQPNAVFEIVNLIGQKPCTSCYAVASTSIKSTELSGDRIVTEADYSLLRASAEEEIADKRQLETTQLQGEDIYTNPQWYKNINSEYIFDKKLGEQAEQVALNVANSLDLYYLPQVLVLNRIKEIHPGSDIKKTSFVSYTGDFGGIEPITLKFFYTYTLPTTINKGEIETAFKTMDFETASQKIQSDYPTVASIKKQDKGLPIKSNWKKVDIKVVQK
jgi:hypothetical protein